MPNIWMHLEYGQQLAEELQGEIACLADIKTSPELYQLGCQGPDILLYHSFLPWKKKTGPSGSVISCIQRNAARC